MVASTPAVETRPRPVRERLLARTRPRTIRLAVWIGFAAVLAVWVVAALSVTRDIDELERRRIEAFTRHADRDDLLSRLRQAVLVGGIDVRDAILDGTPAPTEADRALLATSRRAALEAASAYRALTTGADQLAGLAELEREVDIYWAALERVVSGEPRGAEGPRQLLRRLVLPRREQIIVISNRIRALNRAAFESERLAHNRLYRVIYRRSLLVSGVAALIGLAVAALVIGHAARLEKALRTRVARDAETAAMLHRLSARLVRAQEDERRTIARELHDEVGQALTALKVELSVARREIGDENRAASALDEVRGIADRTLGTVRDLSRLLHPPILEDLGLVSAIDWYVGDYARRTLTPTELLHEGFTDRLPSDVEVAAYRIVQEALTNAARHAHARSIRVFLQRLPASLVVTVEDDGVGFDAGGRRADHQRGGSGLDGIEERVAGLGGRFRLESAPGRGTRLTAELPV